MKNEERSELTDQHLPNKAKTNLSKPIVNALLIGFMLGIIVWSIVKNNLGFFTLIPLYFIYRLLNNSKNDSPSD